MPANLTCPTCGALVSVASQTPRCPHCFAALEAPAGMPGRQQRMAKKDDDDDAGTNDKKKGGSNVLLWVLLGVGVLCCCCCTIGGGGGGWYWYSTRASLTGNWETKDLQGRQEILMLLQSGGKGNYRIAGGPARDFHWSKIKNEPTLELEMNNPGDRLWTNEARTRFTFNLKDNVLTMTPSTGFDKRQKIFTRVN